MKLKRKEAIVLLSFLKFLNSSAEERERMIENALAESGIDRKLSEDISNYYGRKYVESEFNLYHNDYLKALMSNYLRLDIEIIGKSPQLISCPCCGYKTLPTRSEYDICMVCYWEDDGLSGSDANRYSSVNKMTLDDVKRNFENLGVIAVEFLRHVDQDRLLQFEKPNA
ncbi:CPCC family cysteine-rich protein [Mucilaginibacter ginsenosidivorans]|uniref:Cysteine-rich CPCC domain-containing protein n=1 Tax=Mucilaginibacter ginsenosidivorans TaxID=398053 RepID=A0A5B8UZ84_9SPHI|nr:CPCC family cysteine-rich protein [Mucilaginibacter ginsenosidivorans]QEC63681.1 hypothetical protein FRZ54_14210 [Mucilaginibacter ginsenosidivorans]